MNKNNETANEVIDVEEKAEESKMKKATTWMKNHWKTIAGTIGVAACVAVAFVAGKNSEDSDDVDDENVIDAEFDEHKIGDSTED